MVPEQQVKAIAAAIRHDPGVTVFVGPAASGKTWAATELARHLDPVLLLDPLPWTGRDLFAFVEGHVVNRHIIVTVLRAKGSKDLSFFGLDAELASMADRVFLLDGDGGMRCVKDRSGVMLGPPRPVKPDYEELRDRYARLLSSVVNETYDAPNVRRRIFEGAEPPARPTADD